MSEKNLGIVITKPVRMVFRSEQEGSGAKSMLIKMEGGFQFNAREGDEKAGFSKLTKYAKAGVVLEVECSSLKHGVYDTGRVLDSGAKIEYDQFTLVDPCLISISKGKESEAEVGSDLDEVTDAEWKPRQRKTTNTSGFTPPPSSNEEEKPVDNSASLDQIG